MKYPFLPVYPVFDFFFDAIKKWILYKSTNSPMLSTNPAVFQEGDIFHVSFFDMFHQPFSQEVHQFG